MNLLFDLAATNLIFSVNVIDEEYIVRLFLSD